MTRNICIALVFSATLLTGIISAEEPALDKSYNESDYSISPPKDWTVKDFPGMKYKVIVGTPADGFAPNFVFIDEAADMSLEDYAAANEKTVSQVFKQYKKIGSSQFKTNSGAPCFKLITNCEQQGKLLRQIFYFVDGPKGKKFAITCSNLASAGDAADATFDASIKTFKLK